MPQIPHGNFPVCLPTNHAPANDLLRASPFVPMTASPLCLSPEATHPTRAIARSVSEPASLLLAVRRYARVRIAQIRLCPADPLRTAALRYGSKALPVRADPFDCA